MTDHKKEVVFFSLGGTWNAISKNGRIVGVDFLGDDEFYQLEEKFGYFKKDADYNALEWEMAQYLYNLFLKQLEKKEDITKRLHFAPQITNYIKGQSMLLVDFPSDYMRAATVAPIVTILLQYANQHPHLPVLGGMGTDTADISLLPLLDTYTFDSNLPPFLFTGANRSFEQRNSDAPENFYNLARAATLNLSSGGYWVFTDQLFSSSDMVKISPYEFREIDNLSTYYSPHLKSQNIDDLMTKKERAFPRKFLHVQSNHISQKTTLKSLFQAIEKVQIVDVGQEYELTNDMKKILDPNFKAVIVVGHSSGNVNNPVQYACAQAALQDKLVIIISRCLAGDVFEFYLYNTLTANNTYLLKKGKKIISGHKLNKYVARCLAIRAVEENLNQEQTQELFERYTISRHLSEHDVFIV